MEGKNYKKFALMLSASFVIMYTVMFLNVDRLEHVYLSLTRVYMTLLMVSPMALLMLFMMPQMYKNKKRNTMIGALSVVVFVTVLLLMRTQTFIGDDEYIKAMIPHHSSAILNSQEADLKDPELKKLAGEIIKTQEEEITQMKEILHKNK